MINRTRSVVLAMIGLLASGCATTKVPPPLTWTVIDLTQRLSEASPVFPGGVPLHQTPIATYDQGYFAQRMELGEHTGTHVDAPAHFAPGKAAIDQIPMERLIGPAVVLDLRTKVEKNPDSQATVEDLKRWENRHGRVPPGAIVLILTGWDRYWNDPKRYQNLDEKGGLHFPGVSGALAEWLVREREIAGMGIDTLGLDPGNSVHFPAHRILGQTNKYILENLTALDRLPPKGALLFIGPLKIEGGSGAPARVFAILTTKSP